MTSHDLSVHLNINWHHIIDRVIFQTNKNDIYMFIFHRSSLVDVDMILLHTKMRDCLVGWHAFIVAGLTPAFSTCLYFSYSPC